MNNRMLKSRGRKRYTRKMRSEWKQRRPCIRRTRRMRSTRRNGNKRRNTRMRGGVSYDPTDKTVLGIPVREEEALITVPGMGTYSVKAFQQHQKDMDFQGTGGEPGYD